MGHYWKKRYVDCNSTPQIAGRQSIFTTRLLCRPASCGTPLNDRCKRLPSRNFKKADTIYFFFISAQGAETTITQNYM